MNDRERSVTDLQYRLNYKVQKELKIDRRQFFFLPRDFSAKASFRFPLLGRLVGYFNVFLIGFRIAFLQTRQNTLFQMKNQHRVEQKSLINDSKWQ
jgi:hypothetical protein